MTVVGKSWNRLTLPGKIVFTVVPLLLVLTIAAIAAIVLFGPVVIDILANNLPIVRFVVAVTVILLMTIPTAFLIIYMEMKVIALMNLRIGPDRVGPFGSLLSVVHGLKVLMKEDFTPTGRRLARVHVGAGRGLPRQRHVPAGHPVRAGLVRRRHQPRAAVLLRDRRPRRWSAC